MPACPRTGSRSQLRSLFFLLAGLLDRFHALRYSLAAILLVIGCKMFFADWLKETIGPHFNLVLFAFVATMLAGGVVASILPRRSAR